MRGRYLFTYFFIPLFFLISLSAQAASTETVIELPKVEYVGNASFETLNQDSFVPPVTTELKGDRGTTLDTLKWQSAYPQRNLGFPGGASGVNAGGRSIEDTQVTTLGVPLNLPQGGGADFSPFPSFLWDSVSISPSTSGAGFSPSASEGRIDFAPWTRGRLLDPKQKDVSRFTVSYDHDSQTYSLGTKKGPYSAVIGASTGKQSGIAGEASAVALQTSDAHVLIHVIATDMTSDSPGSISFPTPGATQETWRVIPVVETGFRLLGNFEYQSTAFADLSQLKVITPTDATGNSDSNTRTQQFGWENALVHGQDTLAFSARYVTFAGASYGALHDWPVYAAYTHEFFLSDETSLKMNGGAVHSDGMDAAPAGKISAKFASSEKTYPFAEVNTTAKLPTLINRYSSYPGLNFHGNPDLKPERVWAALFGYRFEQDEFLSTTTFKSEYRTGIQVSSTDFSTVVNAGDAYLFTLSEDLAARVLTWLDGHASTYFTFSKLKDSGFSYPDLPFVTSSFGLSAHYRQKFFFNPNARLVGFSAGPGGKAHAAYTLFDTEIAYELERGILVKGGIDNLFGSQGQAVLDYPLEGRLYFASLTATF